MVEIITASILLITLFIYVGISRYKKQGGFFSNDASEYFIWDKKANYKLVGFSYAASMVSAFVFIGIPGVFYTHGIGGWLFICLPVIAGTSTLYWFAPRFYELAKLSPNNYSPFELIGLSYKSKKLGGVVFILSALFVIPLISMQIVGFGRLLEGMFNIDYHFSIFILMSLFIGYMMFAGMEGDVKTDLWQAVAMLFGLIFVAIIAINTLLTNNSSINSENYNLYLSVPGPNGYFTTESLVSIGLIMAALPLVNGHYLMRFMIAKDKNSLKSGVIVAPLVIFSFYILAAIIGLVGIIIEPSLDSGDKLTGVLLGKISDSFGGAIIVGIVLFSIISASLSSVDSQFLSLGAGAAKDIFKNIFNYDLTQKQQLRVGQLIMAGVGLAAIFIAFDPPRLVVQLNIMAASGVMLLLPTVIGGVFYPYKFHVSVPIISITSGVVVFIFLAFTEGGRDFSSWNAGVLATIVSTFMFFITALLFNKRISSSE